MFVFEWDENKEKSNRQKHRISFAGAQTIFDDPFLITFSDEFHSHEEERLISIGISSSNRILLTVHTEVSENAGVIVIRIISCRKATALERKIYEQQR
jgi:uncharacterized protein